MNESVDIAIITVLPEEYRAVRQLIHEPKFWSSPKSKNTHAWILGAIPSPPHNGSYSVVVAMPSKAGQEYIQPAIQATVETFGPSYVFVCGIAAGIHKSGVTNGDVIISETIWGYEYGKIVSGQFQARLDNTYRADDALITLANALNYSPKLNSDQMNKLAGRMPKKHIGTIASGNKVIDDVSYDMVQTVLRTNPRIIGIEMEAIGAIVCARHIQSSGRDVQFLMVRSASDVPDKPDRGNSALGTIERDEWKQLASSIAADVTMQLIAQGLPTAPRAARHKAASAKRGETQECEDSIIRATAAANLFTQPDGGVACACPKDSSGCWTTASWLEVLLVPPIYVVNHELVQKYAEFLISNQNPDGGWPNITNAPSTAAATGHAHGALFLYNRSPEPKSAQLQTQLNTTIKKAEECIFSFLSKPYDLSITDALYLFRSTLVLGAEIEMDAIQPVLRKIYATKLQEGGWSQNDSQQLCVSNTARALWILLHFGMLSMTSKEFKNSLTRLRSSIIDKKGWRVTMQRITTVGRYGETIIHNNTNCDALNLCRVLRRIPADFKNVYIWLRSTQASDGTWTITGPEVEHLGIPAVTWPTSEFLFTLKSIYRLL